jgi:hypothetical protein
MIGVFASESEHIVVSELFELFKTPWEFCRPRTHYDVLLCAGDPRQLDVTAHVMLVYSSSETAFDAALNLHVHEQQTGARVLSWSGRLLPVYGKSMTFGKGNQVAAKREGTFDADGRWNETVRCTTVRVGYDLFAEVRELLTTGQPSIYAEIPTLDMHIALLRELIVGSGVPLVEIPPVPEGHQFIACLTHDVDHPSLRSHGLDHTTLGFLFRATVGTAFQVATGRVPIHNLWRNWIAALKLPFVHLGLAKDFWSDFDRYLDIEQGAPSTFFMIPFRDHAGLAFQGRAPRFRASGYAAADYAEAIHQLQLSGCEVGLHGLDAWADSASASREIDEIQRLTGVTPAGIRMHWLFFDSVSPEILEKAGAAYDSTVGYNDAVGYRAGTTQAYKPLYTAAFLELPLHIMDTALFYPSRMHLTAVEAWKRVANVIQTTVEFGGILTVNWHDRSIAPERLWDGFYETLVKELKKKRTWFATMRQASAWFRKRRAANLEGVQFDGAEIRGKVLQPAPDDTPGLCLRLYKPQTNAQIERAEPLTFSDIALTPDQEIGIELDFDAASSAAHL